MTYTGHENEGHKMVFTDSSANIQQGLELYGNNNAKASQAHFFSAGGGKVGINTANPNAPLQIDQNVGGTDFRKRQVQF